MPLSGKISIQPRRILGLVAQDVEADDFGAAQAAGKADEQHGAVAQAAQAAAVERFQHGDQILGQDRFLLHRRFGVAVADAGEHGGDVAILAVERPAALGIVPGQRRQPPLDRRHRFSVPADAGGLGGDVEADGLRIRRKYLQFLAPAPGAKMLPVGRVGAARVGGTGGLDIGAGAIGEGLQMRRQTERRPRPGRRFKPGRGCKLWASVQASHWVQPGRCGCWLHCDRAVFRHGRGLPHGAHDVDDVAQLLVRCRPGGSTGVGRRAGGRCRTVPRVIFRGLIDGSGHLHRLG